MSEPSIRRANETDIDALVAFNQGIARETEGRELDGPTLAAGITALLADETLGFYIVALNDEHEVVGCLMVTREWSDWRNRVFWWVQSVYVRADHRRRGIYRRLYEHVKHLAEAHNVCGFRLYVERDNRRAQATYERLGMVETHYRMYEEML